MTSRDILTLSLECRVKYMDFAEKCAHAGIKYILTCTYRSPEEQIALLKQKRTRAKPGQSKHNCVDKFGRPASRAFDIVLMIDGKPEWTGNHPLWKKVGKCGKECGLVWGGDWKSIKDWGHFELKE